MPTAGILALQGDFAAHAAAVESAGFAARRVCTAAQIAEADALIIPGGESTTMLKLIEIENLTGPIQDFGKMKPILGTCAGAILLARHVTNPVQFSFNLMDIEVERNGYGRQLDSAIAMISLNGVETEAVFIRAPIIRQTGPLVKVLASYKGNPVLVEQGLHMAATFHPELATSNPVHKLFLERLR